MLPHGAGPAQQITGNALAHITTTDDEHPRASKARWQGAVRELVYRQNRASPLNTYCDAPGRCTRPIAFVKLLVRTLQNPKDS
jgi:hypothetical protein